ncbi:hypothetical protein [Leifsonia xyli]|uniref:hypothetical protein n=1 Tax=Leifsonia xyli TaxID=1575 RepID=UPI0012FE596C
MNTNRHSRLSQLRDFWLDHLWCDLVLGAVLATIHLLLVLIWPSMDVLGNAAPADRRAAYTSVAVVVSLLASFSAVAIGQLSSAKGARADALRNQGGVMLAKNWRSIFWAGLATAGVSIAALLLDPSRHTNSAVPVVVRWVFEFALLVAVVKFARLSTLFNEVLSIAALSAADEDETPGASKLTAAKRWKDKQAS